MTDPLSAEVAAATAPAALVRRDFRHTKIVCTLGPASRSMGMIQRLATAGMNVARLNMSHGERQEHWLAIRHVKSLNQKLNHPIALLMDLRGPEIRTGALDRPIKVEPGEWVTLATRVDLPSVGRTILVDQELSRELPRGQRISLDNGLMSLEVLDALEGRLVCRVIDGGLLGSRKHVNVPGVRVNLPALTPEDLGDIELGVKNDVDFLALSFVRSAEAVRQARDLVRSYGGHAKIIAKVENQEGVDRFDEILEAADGIMAARGDLGVEVPMEELPAIQRSIVRRCAIAGKPVIVATHLLESMTERPTPTRAEVTDVANAVYEQADALMLSAETAAGRDPVRCVEVLDRIVRRTEKEPALSFHRERTATMKRADIAKSACRLADSIGARAIVVITRRGLLAELVASFRPERAIIYAFSNMSATRRKLWLLRSVVPFVIDFSRDPEKTIRAAFEKLRRRNRLAPLDTVVVVSNVDAGGESVTSIQVRVFQ